MEKIKNRKGAIGFSGIIFLVFISSLIMTSWVLLVDDFETNYIDNNISSASSVSQNISSQTASAQELNDTFKNTREAISDVSESETSFETFAQGAVAIPTFFIDFVASIPTFISLTIQQTVAFTTFLNIPTEIVLYFSIGIAILFVIIMIGQMRRYQV